MTKKPVPKFKTDQEAIDFVDNANLDEYDLTAGAIPMREWKTRFEQYVKDTNVNLRLSESLLNEYRKRAEKEHMPTQRLMRLALEKFLAA